MNEFKIGDVCVIVGSYMPELNGRECMIIGQPTNGDDWVLEISGKDASEYGRTAFSGNEINLRKKHPPQELSSWEEIEKLTQWHPERIEV